MKNKTLAAVAALLTLTVCGVAYAQTPDFDNKPIESIFELINYIKEGNWRIVAGFVLMGIMFGLNKWRERVPFFKGDRGGAILVLVLALVSSVSAALFSNAGLDLELIVGAVSVAFSASGGYTIIKRIIWPKDKEEAEIK